MRERNYIPRIGKIIQKKELAPKTFGFKIKLGGAPFHFIPGQFVMLSVPGFGEVPIGIASTPADHRSIEVAVRETGSTTKKICSLTVGDEIGVSGPFGNGLPMAKLKGRDVVIISGGLGLVPLRSFIKKIGQNPKYVKSLTVLNGAKTPKDLLYAGEYATWLKFAEVHLTVDTCDSKWEGCVGMITELFRHTVVKKGAVMLVCGPPVMFKAVIERYAGKRVADKDLYLFLERRMHCGIGKCQHCTCGKEYVCLDGPIFPHSRLKYNQEAFK